MARAYSLFSFGSKIFVANLVGVISDNSYAILIGKLFSSKEVGFYAKAKSSRLVIC
ncbi:oligosaccharide flippase family protein [Escherichia coli]|uniref:oligosaccharide flippase family protein n=1 Tax=Escherichia coli TaxID=562 RepID=UPI0020230EE5|nr:oligosaccharide flippase family protein [Escherichia coli]